MLPCDSLAVEHLVESGTNVVLCKWSGKAGVNGHKVARLQGRTRSLKTRILGDAASPRYARFHKRRVGLFGNNVKKIVRNANFHGRKGGNSIRYNCHWLIQPVSLMWQYLRIRSPYA